MVHRPVKYFSRVSYYCVYTPLTTLVALTLVILFSKMLNFFGFFFSNMFFCVKGIRKIFQEYFIHQNENFKN